MPHTRAELKTGALTIVCLIVLGITLSLGLWPFHSPANQASWLEGRNGVHFGKYGTIFSRDPFPPATFSGQSEATIEIWIRPQRLWNTGTFLAFYDPRSGAQMSLQQSQTRLHIANVSVAAESSTGDAGFEINDVFRRDRADFLTVALDPSELVVYADGALSARITQFRIRPSDLTGQVILAGSARQPDSWPGEILGLALYRRRLTANQVERHYADWRKGGQPRIAAEEGLAALYTFDERGGTVVLDKAHSGVNLYFPEDYEVVDKVALEPFWKEFEMSKSYWTAALKNIVGFVPFGFSFLALWRSVLSERRAMLLTLLSGIATSVTIEVVQIFLPMRDSGTTDILTNTLGTSLGALCYYFFVQAWTHYVPTKPLPIMRK